MQKTVESWLQHWGLRLEGPRSVGISVVQMACCEAQNIACRWQPVVHEDSQSPMAGHDEDLYFLSRTVKRKRQEAVATRQFAGCTALEAQCHWKANRLEIMNTCV